MEKKTKKNTWIKSFVKKGLENLSPFNGVRTIKAIGQAAKSKIDSNRLDNKLVKKLSTPERYAGEKAMSKNKYSKLQKEIKKNVKKRNYVGAREAAAKGQEEYRKSL